MQKKVSLKSWLDYLRCIAPITGVVHVGAGTGAVAARYAEWEVASVVLVEADESLHDKLKAAVQGHPGWSAVAALVSDTGGSKDFYVASNSNESGVLSPDRLAGIWRNLKTKEKRRVQATTLSSLLYGANRRSEEINWAIIDCMPVVPIVVGSGQLVDECEVLIARVVLDESRLAGDGATKAELDALLFTRGFRCLAWEEDLQPAVGMALYVRDWKASLRSRIAASEARALEHSKLAGEWQARLELLKKAHNEQFQLMAQLQQQMEQLAEARDKQAKFAQTLHSQLEQLTQERDDKAKLAGECQQQVEQLAKARDEQAKLAADRQLSIDKHIADVTKQTEQFATLVQSQEARLEKMEKGLKTHLSKELGSSTRQIESFIGIETYLTRGELLPTLHGWPVSPDFALYLINLIETNEYDLVLEFGSGTSTLLMARTVLQKLQRTEPAPFKRPEAGSTRELSVGNGDSAGHTYHVPSVVRERVRPSATDLPPRIISFEHHHKYYDESLTRLHQGGVAELVELNHAPLRDYVTSEGDRFLFYACEERIAAVAGLLSGRRANILVLVDGPPAATGKHARYPALPIVLQHLAAHRLDVLLDDFNRKEEQEIVERWVEGINRRSLSHEKTTLAFEKGACLLSIN